MIFSKWTWFWLRHHRDYCYRHRERKVHASAHSVHFRPWCRSCVTEGEAAYAKWKQDREDRERREFEEARNA